MIGAAAAALAAKVRFHLEFPAFENNYRVETRSDAVRGDGFDAFDDGSLDRSFEDINAERLVPPASVASSNAALTVASAFRRALDAAIAATPAKPRRTGAGARPRGPARLAPARGRPRRAPRARDARRA